ncbi:MAG: type II toxin-antitoxin system HicB family antitoxin [Methylococcales symbiont of Hymedesmia sp. n. MRB-2018]|nr:MAG: type II toxin-antitoxin system HicB family antitoxin [Methylococcales symbiont of Hymedesmia sp. n. MRB-2018]KAF3984265.1 MAG: type II toxin-antitoxin system HicB family antitoxin [Methylococcales symbiont of Hymedesmia sp. n. MRB-2018]
MNIMEINGYRALIQYDSEIEMFRGEFIGLNGSADFYESDIEGLKKEGGISLKVFLQMCVEDGVEPKKNYSGKFNIRIPPELHEDIAGMAISEGKSLNQWVAETLNYASHP